MKQVVVKRGLVELVQVPAPTCGPKEVLVKTKYSFISTGTEMSNIAESGKTLYRRAKTQPDNVSIVMEMVRRHGLIKTWQLIKKTLSSSLPVGYSMSGEIIEVGREVTGYAIGDRVACGGAGKANHAQFVTIPVNLVAKIPKEVSYLEASSVTIGAIALQGIRQANPKLGDVVVVSGLGLLGLLSVQLLKANGCNVIGIDPDEQRLKLAREFGASHALPPGAIALNKVNQETSGMGADIVIITASSESNNPINDAMRIVRKKGRVVVVGAVGLDIKRSPFYEKEVELTISCSYGPGRYDSKYEEEGVDYPYGYVRWTENRNMLEFLRLISNKQINIQRLIDGHFVIDAAQDAYQSLKAGIKPLAAVLSYPDGDTDEEKVEISIMPLSKKLINVAVIGAGSFATSVHLPNLLSLKEDYQVYAIVDKNGLIAKQAAEQFQVTLAETSYDKILKDNNVDLIMITTRHDLHAKQSIEALKAGKAVFCEKPMSLDEKMLESLIENILKAGKIYSVGYNRRYSPFAKKIKEVVKDRVNPIIAYYRMNAGYIPLDHWVHTKEGGGRIIGEACHIFDLFSYLTDSAPVSVASTAISPKNNYYSSIDNKMITIKYSDGSVCTLAYFANGATDLDKEYLEIHFDNKTIILDDYKKLSGIGLPISYVSSVQDKGHRQELVELADSIRTGSLPIPLSELEQTSRLSLIA